MSKPALYTAVRLLPIVVLLTLLACDDSQNVPTPVPAAKQIDEPTPIRTAAVEGRGTQAASSPTPESPVATASPQRSPVPPQVFPMAMQVTYVTAENLAALVADSTLIVIGTTSDAEPREEGIPGRLPGDSSKPDPNYTSISNVYEVEVERYLKGDGNESLSLIQSIGFDAIVPGRGSMPDKLTQGRNSSLGVRLSGNSRYMLFLHEFGDAPGRWTGTAEPYRFLFKDGRAQVESPVGNVRGEFESRSEDELVSLVESFIEGKSVAETSKMAASETPDGATWVLKSVEGSPPVDSTFAALRVNGESLTGFDGCNSVGGKNQDGTPVVAADGAFSPPGMGGTEMLCVEPQGVMEQADALIGELMQGESFRVDGNQLEIIDGAGKVRLVFIRQEPLLGQQVDLVGTAWQLVVEEDDSDVQAPTLAFLTERMAVGVATCRGYIAGYRMSEGRVRFPSLGMSGSAESCANELVRAEGSYTSHFTWADEYSVDDSTGEGLLRIRTRRGETLVFEPLSPAVDSVFAGQWSLTTFVEARGQDYGLRDTDVIPKTEVTIEFTENGVSGSAGCNSYSAPVKVEDATIDVGPAGVTRAWCDVPERLMEQERRYLDILSRASHYSIYGDRLALLTNDDEALLFRLH